MKKKRMIPCRYCKGIGKVQSQFQTRISMKDKLSFISDYRPIFEFLAKQDWASCVGTRRTSAGHLVKFLAENMKDCFDYSRMYNDADLVDGYLRIYKEKYSEWKP